MFSTLGIIWYWFTLAYFTFGTPSDSGLVVVLLVHQTTFWHTRIVLGHFGTIGTILTFGTQVAFWYTENRISV